MDTDNILLRTPAADQSACLRRCPDSLHEDCIETFTHTIIIIIIITMQLEYSASLRYACRVTVTLPIHIQDPGARAPVTCWSYISTPCRRLSVAVRCNQVHHSVELQRLCRLVVPQTHNKFGDRTFSAAGPSGMTFHVTYKVLHDTAPRYLRPLDSWALRSASSSRLVVPMFRPTVW